jgi:hypothetical protein
LEGLVGPAAGVHSTAGSALSGNQQAHISIESGAAVSEPTLGGARNISAHPSLHDLELTALGSQLLLGILESRHERACPIPQHTATARHLDERTTSTTDWISSVSFGSGCRARYQIKKSRT